MGREGSCSCPPSSFVDWGKHRCEPGLFSERVSQQAQTDASGHMCRCVSQAFFGSPNVQRHLSVHLVFVYLYIQRIFWGREILCFQGVLPKMQPPPAGLMNLSWAVSCPNALPILKQADGKQRRKLRCCGVFLVFFFNLLFHPCPHNTALAWPTEAEASVRASFGAGISCKGINQMVGVYVYKCMVSYVHEC